MRYYRSSNKKLSKNSYKRKGKVFSNSRKEKRFRQYDSASAVNFSNPFNDRINFKPLRLKEFLFSVVFLSWLLLLIYLPFFRISNIQINGLKLIDKQELLNIIESKLSYKYRIVPGNNYLFVNPEKIESDILQNFQISEVEINKRFPNSLVVNVTEKASSIILDNGESYYLLGNNGEKLKYLAPVQIDATNLFNTSSTSTIEVINTHIPDQKLFTKEYPDLPIVYNEADVDTPISNKMIESVLSAHNEIRRGREFKVSYFKTDEINNEIEVFTDKKWKIILSGERSISDQISSLWNIIHLSKPTEYIDLRLADRLFWK